MAGDAGTGRRQRGWRRSLILALILGGGTIALAVFLLRDQPLPDAFVEAAPVDTSRTHDLYVVGHGWHPGLVIERRALSAAAWPEVDAFLDHLEGAAGIAYVEVGWGDAGYYPAEDPGLGEILGAAITPTPGVLHVVGLRRHPADVFPNSEVVRLRLTPDGLARLAAFVRAEYARTAAGGVIDAGPGLYGRSRFYRGTTPYHAFYNCNHWIAEALQAAGQPVRTRHALTAGRIMAQVRGLGEVVSGLKVEG